MEAEIALGATMDRLSCMSRRHLYLKILYLLDGLDWMAEADSRSSDRRVDRSYKFPPVMERSLKLLTLNYKVLYNCCQLTS